jgi:hypothetical protein
MFWKEKANEWKSFACNASRVTSWMMIEEASERERKKNPINLLN